MSSIKQAVILCAGLGTRLKPYTDTMPKAMLPVLGKPMLQWHVEQFKKHGVTEFFINLHYLPDVIKNYFGDGGAYPKTPHSAATRNSSAANRSSLLEVDKATPSSSFASLARKLRRFATKAGFRTGPDFGVKISYNFEPTILGTAGGVKQFEGKLDDEFFLIYGDTFSLVDYSKMRETWEKLPANKIGMQRMKKTNDYADADVAELDSTGKFIAIHPKPHVEKYANAYRMRGVFILKKKILSFVPPNVVDERRRGDTERSSANVPYEIGKHLLPDVVKKGEAFYSYECDDYSKGIDTLEKWKEVEEYLCGKQISNSRELENGQNSAEIVAQ